MTSTQVLLASPVAKASTPNLDRHLAQHVRLAQLTWTATQPLLAQDAPLAATVRRLTAFRAPSALTTTMRMLRPTVSRVVSAHSPRKVAQNAFRALLASTTTIWIHPLLVMGTTLRALQDTTLAWVARAATHARVAQLTWTVMHLLRARHVMLERTQSRER